MTRVLICDDQLVVSEGLRVILSTAPGIEVVGTASNGREAIDAVAKLRPDVVLMDLKMPVMNGIQATRVIRAQYPAVHVLVLTTYAIDDWIFDAISSGASGYLLKDTPRAELVNAIQGTAEGKTYLDPGVAGKLVDKIGPRDPKPSPDQELLFKLSEREVAVLRLLGQGSNNADIAQKLSLSAGTVRNYVSSILTKLEVSDRTQAAILALRAGLVEHDIPGPQETTRSWMNPGGG